MHCEWFQVFAVMIGEKQLSGKGRVSLRPCCVHCEWFEVFAVMTGEKQVPGTGRVSLRPCCLTYRGPWRSSEVNSRQVLC